MSHQTEAIFQHSRFVRERSEKRRHEQLNPTTPCARPDQDTIMRVFILRPILGQNSGARGLTNLSLATHVEVSQTRT